MNSMVGGNSPSISSAHVRMLNANRSSVESAAANGSSSSFWSPQKDVISSAISTRGSASLSPKSVLDHDGSYMTMAMPNYWGNGSKKCNRSPNDGTRNPNAKPALVYRLSSSEYSLPQPSYHQTSVQAAKSPSTNKKKRKSKKNSFSFAAASPSSSTFPKAPLRKCKSMPNISLGNDDPTVAGSNYKNNGKCSSSKRKLGKPKWNDTMSNTDSLPLFWFRPRGTVTAPPSAPKSPSIFRQQRKSLSSSPRAQAESMYVTPTKQTTRPLYAHTSVPLPTSRPVSGPHSPLPLNPKKSSSSSAAPPKHASPYTLLAGNARPTSLPSAVSPTSSSIMKDDGFDYNYDDDDDDSDYDDEKLEEMYRERLQSSELQGLSFVEEDDFVDDVNNQ